VRPRPAVPKEPTREARIYNQGIEERIATFETRTRTAEKVRFWFGRRHPMIVVEEGGDVVTFAATSEYSSRGCYTGVAEFSAHADRGARGRGAGGMTMAVLILAAEQAGFWKLLSRIFVETFSTSPGTGARRWSSS
jgi:phosphinothricin acetyltransferase